MRSEIIKVRKQKNQCSITVPRKIAIELGIDKAEYLRVWVNRNGRLEVKVIELK